MLGNFKTKLTLIGIMADVNDTAIVCKKTVIALDDLCFADVWRILFNVLHMWSGFAHICIFSLLPVKALLRRNCSGFMDLLDAIRLRMNQHLALIA